MNTAGNEERRAIIWLLLLTAAIYVGSAGIPALLDDADSFYAEVARAMNERGDWITPYANGLRYLEKPPLFFWLIAASYKLLSPLLGLNAFTARLPTALAVVALTFVTTRIGKLLFGGRAGLFAGYALATSFGTFLFTRIILPDALFSLLLALTVYAFLRWEQEPEGSSKQGRWLLAVYALGALAVLAKGLIGVAFPGGVIVFTMLFTGRWRVLLRMISLKGILLFLLIAAPWHLAIGARNPGFYWFYFVNEHLLRFLGRRYPMDYGTVPLVPFWLLHLVWLFPWSFYLATLLWPANFKAALAEHGRALIVPLAWALTILLFFSFSSRLEYYTLPAFPALALLAGRQCAQAWEHNRRGASLTLLVLGALVGLALIAAAVASQAVTSTSFLQLKDNPELYAYYLGHLFDLTPESLRALRLPLVLAGIGLGLFLPLHHFIQGARRKAEMLAVGVAVFFVAANLAFGIFAPRMTSEPLAREITRRAAPDARIVIDGEYEEGCSVAFYAHRTVLMHNGRSSNLEWGSRYPDAPPLFPDDARLQALWQESPRVFLLTFQNKLAKIEALLPERRYTLASYGDKLLLSNQPDAGK